MKSSEIRQKFLDYFVQHDHRLVPSSSLVPANDPTLLFTNAGMVQFKNTFLGLEQPLYLRACSVQKCMRVSGKHNDLEEVGPSPRHHTFFEMLGNFSFGDYFKREAIHYAWELLTEGFLLPVERLWVTVHTDDDEAARIWQDIGVDPQRILRFADNVWTMGETGPCGHNSEIHYYQGPDVQAQRAEGVNSDDDDYVEIWNLVFMQYNRDEQGYITPLPSPSVDTGMGLERPVSILQGVKSVYETDLFRPIIQRIIELLGQDQHHYQENCVAYHVVADHSRSIAFLLADGVLPGNTGHGYVLRRLIRRAAYFGQTLGFRRPFVAPVIDTVIETMGESYPELYNQRNTIANWTTAEEERFSRTLKTGLRLLYRAVERLSTQGEMILPGRDAFKLHDTYGFPLDLTQKILAKDGLTVNVEEYEQERREQQNRSRIAARLKHTEGR
jgi:alanyl-tRNA synthetase